MNDRKPYAVRRLRRKAWHRGVQLDDFDAGLDFLAITVPAEG
jgi:hypothetical protein